MEKIQIQQVKMSKIIDSQICLILLICLNFSEGHQILTEDSNDLILFFKWGLWIIFSCYVVFEPTLGSKESDFYIFLGGIITPLEAILIRVKWKGDNFYFSNGWSYQQGPSLSIIPCWQRPLQFGQVTKVYHGISLLVRAKCVGCPWALQAVHSGHY